VSVSAFEHVWLGRLLGDEAVARELGPDAMLRQMLLFEVALALAEGAEGVIPAEAAEFIAEHVPGFHADDAAIAAATARDGVVVPELVRQLRELIGPPHAQHLHFGATSQDVTDTALVLQMRAVLIDLKARLETLAHLLAELDGRFGGNELMGRTRMQDALPIRVSDRIGAWRLPLRRHVERLDALLPRLLVVQFGGAAGTLDKLGDRGPAVAARLAQTLALGLPERSWHSQRDNLAELGSWLSLVSGSLGKLGMDIGLMAQNRFGEIALAGGGGSSAMPHKSNPVGAEVLVALARYNATLVGGMHQALVHEQERSGAAWTLEWLTLPQMLMTTAAGLRTALTLCGNITRIGAP
jgi:3-carboxy-cis,cis-muconate cycloisomerase